MRASRIYPTTSGLTLLVAVSSLFVFRPTGPLADLLLWGLCSFLLVAYFSARRSGLEDVKVSRHLPPRATKGDALAVTHELENTGSRLLRQLWVSEERAAGSGPESPVRTFFPQLLPHGFSQASTRLFVGRRGRLRFRGITLEATDSSGLFMIQERRVLEGEVVVHPKPQQEAGRAVLSQLEQVRGGRLEPEWESVRDWRAGDPWRAIHWRLTARRGFPVVRVGRGEQARVTRLVLDRRVEGATVHFEHAVAVAAGIALALLDRGFTLEVEAPSPQTPLLLSQLRGRSGRERLLHELALLLPEEPHALKDIDWQTLASGSLRGAVFVSCLSDPGPFPAGAPLLLVDARQRSFPTRAWRRSRAS